MKVFEEKRSLQDDLALVDMGEYSAKLCLRKKREDEVLLEDFRVHEYKNIRMEERIKEAISAAAGFHARNITFTFTPSVLKTRVFAHSLKRDYPRNVIRETEARELEKKMLKEIEEKGKESIADQFGILGDEFSCAKSSLIAMKVDGYEVPHLQGFSGEIVEFRMAYTFLLETARSSLAKSMLSSTMKLRGAYEVSSSLQTFCENNAFPNALFADVGDLETRFFLFSGGDLASSGEFKEGGEGLTHAIERSFGMSRKSALELKHRYGLQLQKEGVSEGARKKLKELFDPELSRWKLELFRALDAQGKAIPDRVFLFGGGSIIPGMRELFEEGSLLLPRDIVSRSSLSPQYTSLALCALASVSI